ncbi:MAG TPA: Zn-ribbon domain-containing OB-fold protein [Dehalococcoidia bacterium]|jgi:hypothetical protein|nr:Zn-ribbon domain-containing OB-fold protein [Dehalococcoidia bacterium]
MRVLETEVCLPYKFAYGSVNSRFFEEMEKNRRIMGTRCPQCHRVLVPARKFCPRCFVDPEEWVQVSDQGKVRTWSLVNYSFAGEPKPPPYVVAIIDLDGADVGFLHFIGDIDLSDVERVKEEVKIGLAVRAVWSEQRSGTIMDIKHFAPLK